jgi:hypothetical protein
VVLALEPKNVNFGKVKRGAKSATKYVSLTGIDKDITKITSVTSGNRYVKAETILSDSEDSKKELIRVTVLPGIKMGFFREKITINTDHEKLKKLSLYVRGQIAGNIHVSPVHLSFSPSRKNRKIELKAFFDATFKVFDVTSTTPDLVTRVETIKEGLEYRVLVRTMDDFDFNFEDSVLKGKITIRTDDKEQENIDIKFSIYGKGPRKTRKDKSERVSKKPQRENSGAKEPRIQEPE